MFKRRQPKRRHLQEKHVTLSIDGQAVPARLFWEQRNNVRMALGKKAVLIRLPHWITEEQEREQLAHFKQTLGHWLEEGKLDHYFCRRFEDGEVLRVGERTYTVSLTEANWKRNRVHIDDHRTIHIRLGQALEGTERWQDIETLLHRAIAQDFMPAVTQRVHELNAAHFRKPVNRVYFKQNYTNSGSCSSHGNINLTTRLLFAPPPVLDYVIIHELAHLIEANHSDRFWKLVANAMPDYERWAKWLKKHGRSLGF